MLGWVKDPSNSLSSSTCSIFQLQHVKMLCCLWIYLPGTLNFIELQIFKFDKKKFTSKYTKNLKFDTIRFGTKCIPPAFRITALLTLPPSKMKNPLAWCCSLHFQSIISNGVWNISLLALDTWAAVLFSARQPHVSFRRWRYLHGHLLMVSQSLLMLFRMQIASGKKKRQLSELQFKAELILW